MGTIKGKRQFNRLNKDLDELYRRINDDEFQYKTASASFFAEKIELLLHDDVLKSFLTSERISEITDMTQSLTSNINLKDGVRQHLKKVIESLYDICSNIKTDEAVAIR